MTNQPKLPDRTEVLVAPGGGMVAALAFSSLLVYFAYHKGQHHGREKLLAAALRGIGELLGPTASIVVGVVLVGIAGFALGKAFVKYRALVAEDRAAAGL